MFQLMQILAVLGWREYRVSVGTSLMVMKFVMKKITLGLSAFDHLLKPLQYLAQ